MKLQYNNYYSNNWVDVISLTPVNIIKSFYNNLELKIENNIEFIVVYIEDNKIRTAEINQYSLNDNIKIIE